MHNQLRIQGGGPRGPWPPPLSLLKLVIKKMAAIGGPLYFMFLGPPPSDHAGSDADNTWSSPSFVKNSQYYWGTSRGTQGPLSQRTLNPGLPRLSPQARIQDMGKGAQGQYCIAESRQWQKFGPQNWGSGRGTGPRPP